MKGSSCFLWPKISSLSKKATMFNTNKFMFNLEAQVKRACLEHFFDLAYDNITGWYVRPKPDGRNNVKP